MELNTKKAGFAGFTLTEALISILIFVIVIVAATAALITNIAITSYTKHRAQAMYIAKQALEDMRKHSFSDLAAYAANPTHGTGPVCIDIIDYDLGTCGLSGDRLVQVTNIDTYRKSVRVRVHWLERIAGVSRDMYEYCTTDIYNGITIN